MTQIEYMQMLLDDLGFDRTKRNVWLNAEFPDYSLLGNPVKSLEDMTSYDRSRAIDRLKEMRDSMRDRERAKYGRTLDE